MDKIPNLLTIAGSDPSGGAGIQADLKTFSALGAYGMSVITALTAQNTQGVQAVEELSPSFVKAQLEAIFEDIQVDAVKIGMAGSAKTINTIAEIIEQHKEIPVILDPVMVATSGDSLLSGDAIEALKGRLIPLSTILTPNIPEAEKLSRRAVLEMEEAACSLLSLGSQAVYLKGGHMSGKNVRDILAHRNQTIIIESPRIDTNNTHGTGCTLSAALAVYLACGKTLEVSARAAHTYVHNALEASYLLSVGKGNGPIHHFYEQVRIRQ